MGAFEYPNAELLSRPLSFLNLIRQFFRFFFEFLIHTLEFTFCSILFFEFRRAFFKIKTVPKDRENAFVFNKGTVFLKTGAY